MDEREIQIIKILKQHPEGLSIEQIAKYLNISTITCVRILDRMVVTGMIRRREIGKAKLHYSGEV